MPPLFCCCCRSGRRALAFCRCISRHYFDDHPERYHSITTVHGVLWAVSLSRLCHVCERLGVDKVNTACLSTFYTVANTVITYTPTLRIPAGGNTARQAGQQHSLIQASRLRLYVHGIVVPGTCHALANETRHGLHPPRHQKQATEIQSRRPGRGAVCSQSSRRSSRSFLQSEQPGVLWQRPYLTSRGCVEVRATYRHRWRERGALQANDTYLQCTLCALVFQS